MDNELKELLTRIATAIEKSNDISKMHLERNNKADRRMEAFYDHVANDRAKKYNATENRYVEMNEEEIVSMFLANERFKRFFDKEEVERFMRRKYGNG